MRYAYTNLWNNCDRRKIFIDLTFEQFEMFCYKVDYMHKKGRGKNNFGIDRIKVGRLPGYTLSNIQIMENGDNSRKRWKEYDYVSKHTFIRSETYIPEVNKEDLPF